MNYDTIKDFQTSIAAIVGFIGVITTLVVNARLARVQNAEKDRKAQATLESALKQELISIRDELKSIRRAATDKGLDSFKLTLEAPYVYHALVKDLGMLPPKKARVVISVYRELYLTMNSVRSLAVDSSTPVVTIHSDQFQDALQWVDHVYNEVDRAIDTLD
jgi:hypothetical protein